MSAYDEIRVLLALLAADDEFDGMTGITYVDALVRHCCGAYLTPEAATRLAVALPFAASVSPPDELDGLLYVQPTAWDDDLMSTGAARLLARLQFAVSFNELSAEDGAGGAELFDRLPAAVVELAVELLDVILPDVAGVLIQAGVALDVDVAELTPEVAIAAHAAVLQAEAAAAGQFDWDEEMF